MNRQHNTVGWCGLIVLVLAGITFGEATTQPAALVPAAEQPSLTESPSAGASQAGQVTGDNVYIRSGSNQNYYPVMKLGRGASVTVVGEEFGWLKILPPSGTFSLVDKNYIDRIDDQTGALNGTTWIYAGSSMSERNYAKQVRVGKGDRVTIMGESADGNFFKIAPPPGAHLWISGDFVSRDGKPVERTTTRTPVMETVKPGELRLTDQQANAALASPTPTVPVAAQPTMAPREPAPKIVPEYQRLKDAIEAEIATEFAKPMAERNFNGAIVKLTPLAEQGDDNIMQLYAQNRIKQLQGHMELAAAITSLRDLRTTAIDEADRIARERERIRVAEATRPNDIAVRGMIKVSGIYTGSDTLPKRWRIVDPETDRTVAYIELPQGSPIDPVQYYGNYVGIRASSRRLMTGTVPPVPIFTVAEIEVMDPRARQDGAVGGSLMTASPAASTIDTQPSATPNRPVATIEDDDLEYTEP
ncbi:MAG: SH3 domain-containing protein [Phycisphaerales bacterium]|nr:SH3 domain-containing protein [Phycisphaerales bacterium]